MKKSNLIIWGAGGHASVVADIVRQQNLYEIAGFLDDVNPANRGRSFEGSRILGGQEQLDSLLADKIQYIIFSFGHNGNRLQLAEVVKEKGFTLATAVHPAAIIAPDVCIGPGSVVRAGAIIEPTVEIGTVCLIGSCVTISHGTILEDGVLLSPGVNIAGNTRVGRGAWIGLGAMVKDRLVVGRGALVGMGSVVLEDVAPHKVVFGVPAQEIRKVRENEF